MTNEELLAKIDEGGARAFQSDSYGWIALRAVVELHKPIDTAISFDKYIGCNACFGWSHEGEVHETYPCPTIQVIERELG